MQVLTQPAGQMFPQKHPKAENGRGVAKRVRRMEISIRESAGETRLTCGSTFGTWAVNELRLTALPAENLVLRADEMSIDWMPL